jgi:transcriptional regulator with XRE-family HTH domain
MNIITDSVKFAMAEQDINISELANLTGFSTTYISKLLRGEKRWNETTLLKTLRALNLEIEIKPVLKGRKRAAI